MLTKYRHGLMWLCIICISTSTVFAQQKRVDKKWYALLQQGVVFNESNVQVQPGLATGLQYKGYGAGLAAGFDFIDLNSLQLCLDLRKSIAVGNQYLFAYANPGANIVVASKKDKEDMPWKYGNEYKVKNGFYLEAGAGILLGKKKNLLAAFYWSRKTHTIDYSYDEWNPSTGSFDKNPRKDKYEFNRLGVKLGIIF